MALEVQERAIDAVKGETNIWDIDASIAIDPGDSIWFTAKNRKSDADADAVLALTKTAAEIVLTDGPNGQFRVTAPPAALASVTVSALIYDCKVKIASTGVIQTVATGPMYLVESVNKDAA